MDNNETGGSAIGNDSADEYLKRFHTACAYSANGFSVIPLGWNKIPAVEWKAYQSQIADEVTLRSWFLEKKLMGIGIVTGSISGNLSVIDFESNDIFLQWMEKCEQQGYGKILEKSVFVFSGKGIHAYFRLGMIPAAGRKLAYSIDVSGKKSLLIETRAAGNYVMAPGSAPECHPNMIPYEVMKSELQIKDTQLIEEETWYAFTTIAESFDETPKNSEADNNRHYSKTYADNSISPAVQDFNDNCDVRKLLTDCGFKLERTEGSEEYWQKPDSSNPGYHCTYNHDSSGRLFNFSTANEPLEANKSYSPFEILTLFKFDGKEPMAEKHIAADGYDGRDYWDEPEKLNELLPVLPMTESMLPESLLNRIVDVSHRMQVAVEAVATAHTITISSVIGAGCGIRPMRNDNWAVVSNLWGSIVAPPASKKSPVRKSASRLLHILEREAQQEFQKAWAQYQIDLEMYKLETENLKQQTKKKKDPMSLSDYKAALSALEKPEPPRERRYRINEASVQKITELLSANPRGMEIETDELAGILATLQQKEYQGERAYFLQAWDGDGDYCDDKIGRGTTRAEHLCLSWLACIQPQRLAQFLRNQKNNLGDDGFFQRFQMSVYPDFIPYNLVDELPDLAAEERVLQIVQRLHDIDFTAIGAKKDTPEGIPYFRFQEDAQLEFYSWMAKNAAKCEQESTSLMQQHLLKYPSLLASLALIFHLIERVDPAFDGCRDSSAAPGVSLDNLMLAEKWCELLESHARRIYSLRHSSVEGPTALLAKAIEQGKLENGFSLRDVQRKAWSGLTDRVDISHALDELAAANWIVEVKRRTRFQQKAAATFRINPKISMNTK